MDWAYKAALTGMTVAAVMMAARLLGRRAAGLLAGLPVISAPALVWLAADLGIDSAVHSAVGGLAACVAAPAFAVAFDHAARRHGAPGALCRALLAFACVLALASAMPAAPSVLLVLALSAALLAWRRVSLPESPAGWVRSLRGEPWLSASLAGLVSASAARLALDVGSFWAGAFAALPVISGFALVHLRRAGQPGDIRRFVLGYVPGVAAKAVFLFMFATVAPTLGAGWALALAAGAGAGTVLAWTTRPGRAASSAGLGSRAGY